MWETIEIEYVKLFNSDYPVTYIHPIEQDCTKCKTETLTC